MRTYVQTFKRRLIHTVETRCKVIRTLSTCLRSSRLKHGSARPRRCAIGPRVPMCAIGRREPPVLHSHWRFCPVVPHRMALPRLAASLPVVASSSWLVLLLCGSVRCTIRCQCAQADDRSRPCSTDTGAFAPWHLTAGSSPRSQRRAQGAAQAEHTACAGGA